MQRSSSRRPPWNVMVYRVSDEDRQQRVLRIVRAIGDPEVTALGTSRDEEWLVAVDCTTPAAAMRVQRWITVVDPRAVRRYSTSNVAWIHREPRRPVPPSTA